MIYSKTLDLADYVWLQPTIDQILTVRDRLADNKIPSRFEHEHRAWEYGLISQALMEVNPDYVVDIGGGASVFAPAYQIMTDSLVIQVDPGEVTHWLDAQEQLLGITLPFANTHFEHWKNEEVWDAVVCLSTLEHVPEDYKFFANLCKKVVPGGILAVTFDFHPSGEQMTGGHIRTYNYESIQELIGIGEDNRLRVVGGCDYEWRGPAVYDYTFAALVMRRGNE